MNWIKCFYAILLLALIGCKSDDLLLPDSPDKQFAYLDGDKIIVNISVDSPDMNQVGTRALEAAPDYNDMHLYLIEFDDNGSPLRNTLKTVYTPISETPQQDRVIYQIVLNQSSQPRVLHLVALPKSMEISLDYGLEAMIIPSLKTEDGAPAYWRRLTFPSGYGQEKDGEVVMTEEMSQLRHVALIRNFSCISMTNDTKGEFIISGFSIVNQPTAGSVAPWQSSDYTFPDFLDDNQQPLDYTSVSSIYEGFAPASLELSNTALEPIVNDDVSPKYLYERPFNSIRHTYLLVKGHLKSESDDTYYKLDLGRNDNVGVFRYFGILRNFNFNVIIKSVDTKGYDTIQEAVSGVVFNNFSFDIELSSMLNVSDGDEVVYINFSTMVLTDPSSQTIEFKYRYRSLSASSPTFNNDDVTFIGLKEGDVIEKYEKSDTNDANGWRSVFITCRPAETETKLQEFTIVKKSGLGRTINLVLHKKWNFTNLKEFAGTLENWNESTPGSGEVADSINSDLTIFFDIPDNLREAIFPLNFVLEADRQNIENNPLGKLVVDYGPSGFPGIDENRIKYVKTVTWSEYNDALTSDINDNGTAINNGDGTFTHRVRCRFLTITALEDFDFSESTTQVLIKNENFEDGYVTFDREQVINNRKIKRKRK